MELEVLSETESTTLERETKRSISKSLNSELKEYIERIYNDFSRLEDLADLENENPIFIQICQSKDAQRVINNMFRLVKSDYLNCYDKAGYKKIHRAQTIFDEKLSYARDMQKRFVLTMLEK